MSESLLRYLLNVEPAPWTEGGEMRLGWLNLPQHDFALLLLLGIVAAAAAILYLYHREGRMLSRFARLSLAALRFLTLAGVLAMLLEPAIIFTKRETIPSRLLVLVDDSESLDFKDAYVDAGQAKRIADALQLKSVDALREQTRLKLAERAFERGLLTKLAENGDRVVTRHDFSGQLFDPQPAAESTRSTLAASTRDRSTTGIGTAVKQALAAYRGQPLAGMLIVTDGQSNTGEPVNKAAEAAAAEGVPLVALAVGTPEGPRNAAITKIDVSPVVFVRDTNQAHVIVNSRGMAGQPANVVFERQSEGGAWEEIGRKPVVLEESGTVQTVTFDFKEDRPTKLVLRATIQDAGPELTTADNVQLAEVRVIRQKIKVLFVSGHSFPEFEFIRNMLLRDNALSAGIWLQTAEKDYTQPGTPGIKRLPINSEELNDFDCVILYDPDPALWPEAFPQMLVDFVGKAGGGLIYVAGERFTKDFFDRPDDPNSVWLPLLPVVSEPGLFRTDVTAKLSAKNAWKLEISPEGHADPVFQFAEKPEENDRILSALPGMFWHYPVTRAKAGATVLARHADPRMRNEYGNHVLLATQLVGPGRSFFVGFDSTYRWRYLDEQTFDGFWARMIDRAGRSKQLGGRYPYSLSTDRAGYRPGSQVTLTARFENPNDKDAGLDQMHGEVELPDAPPLSITLSPRKNDSTAFEATFPVSKAGPHFVKVWAGDPDAKQMIRAATLEFPVELPNLEYDQPTLNLPVLQGLAKATGGAVFDLSEIDQIPDAFKIKRIARVLEDRQPIFNAPLLFGFVLLCLFVEWVLRKKCRLI
ncbi:MAG TPA: hypothetical protein VGY55_19680 [Pirellulales bacterium]|jgi:hypothetical protein|nr:hypothetical protein [Pirellulales bacterium]